MKMLFILPITLFITSVAMAQSKKTELTKYRDHPDRAKNAAKADVYVAAKIKISDSVSPLSTPLSDTTVSKKASPLKRRSLPKKS
ncbi:MAG TPA: hypothetical protein VM012_07345 [Flavitalea sp.]|nr:hypothetical protein [Flavitalea sp.]